MRHTGLLSRELASPLMDMEETMWFGSIAAEELNDWGRASLNENIGIEITEIAAGSLHARMKVDHRTIQPAGYLHGGASVAFAETLASWAGFLAIDRDHKHVVGQEINANHIRPVPAGDWVTGVAEPVYVGKRSHVWQVRISNESGKLVCISRCTLAVIDQASAYTGPENR